MVITSCLAVPSVNDNRVLLIHTPHEFVGVSEQLLIYFDRFVVWLKSERFGGGEGVNASYIQDIEHGRKRIDDQQTLRKVCDLLHIPYWEVGLSEYDPFTQILLPGHGKSMYDETLDTVETLVRQILQFRCAARIPEADKGVKRLGKLFAYFNESLSSTCQT